MESVCNVKFGIIICLIVFATIVVTVIVCAILFVLYAPNTYTSPISDTHVEEKIPPPSEQEEGPTIDELEAELDGIGEEIMREKNEAFIDDLKNRQFDDDVQDLEVSEEQSSVDRIVETQ